VLVTPCVDQRASLIHIGSSRGKVRAFCRLRRSSILNITFVLLVVNRHAKAFPNLLVRLHWSKPKLALPQHANTGSKSWGRP
jgi:hypothetical protein